MSDSFTVSVGVDNLDVCNFFAGFSFVGEFSYESHRVTIMGIEIHICQGICEKNYNTTNERGLMEKKGIIPRKDWQGNPSSCQR